MDPNILFEVCEFNITFGSFVFNCMVLPCFGFASATFCLRSEHRYEVFFSPKKPNHSAHSNGRHTETLSWENHGFSDLEFSPKNHSIDSHLNQWTFKKLWQTWRYDQTVVIAMAPWTDGHGGWDIQIAKLLGQLEVFAQFTHVSKIRSREKHVHWQKKNHSFPFNQSIDKCRLVVTLPRRPGGGRRLRQTLQGEQSLDFD